LGGTPSQITGPTGPMTVVSAAIIGTHSSATGEVNMALIAGTFILAGIFESVLGLLRVLG